MSDDLISRQAVIDLWDKYHPYIATKAMSYDIELRALPSAQSEIIYCGECKYMMPNGRCSAFADPSIRPMSSEYGSNAIII